MPVSSLRSLRTKTRVPRRRTQESFASGTASVHVGLLMPLSAAPSTALSEQVAMRFTSFAAGTNAKQVCVLNHGEMHSTSRAIVQVSGGIRAPIASPHSINASAPSSLRASAAPVCLSLQCRYGECLLQGYPRHMRSWHVFVSRQESKQALLNLAIANAVPCLSTRFSFLSVRQGPKHVRAASYVSGLPTISRAIVQVSGGIRAPIASPHSINAFAASSLRQGAAPVCLVCFSLQCRDGNSVLQGCFLAIANAVPCTCAVRFSLLSVGQGAKHVRVASCASGLPTTSRAIVQVSGGIRATFASPHAINASAPSSLRPRTAPVHLSLQCRYGECLLPGYPRHMRSWHVFVSRQESKHSRFGLATAIAVPCISTVRLSFASAKYGAKHVRVANLVFGLPTRGRAVVLAPCWIRPPISSAHAIRASALSSLRPGTAPVRLSLHGRYGESFLQGYLRRVRSWHVFVSREESKHSLLDLAIANAVPCISTVRFSLLSVRQGPKHVRAASCVSGLPTISRAIVQVLGGNRVPIASPHSINASAPSSLRAGAAPVCLSLQCRYGECLLQGYPRRMRSWHVFVSRQESKHSRFGLAIAIAVPCISTVRLSFASAKYGAKHVRVANLVFGLPTRGRAVVLAPCWIRPPISSAHAILASALSSLRPATAPVRLSLHGRYGESFCKDTSDSCLLLQMPRHALAL